MITIQRFLNNARLAFIIASLALKREAMRPLRFVDRVPTVNATDDEMVGHFRGEVYAADIIALDQASVVYESGALEIVATTIPKLKLGVNIPESVIVKLYEMVRRGATAEEIEAADGREVMRAADLLTGIRQRANALVCAALLDDIVYDRLGVKIIGSFGQPADLKLRVSKDWSDTTAKGITDILTLRTYAENTYGYVYNRLTLSQANLQDLVKQDEFKALATALFPTAIVAGAVNIANLPQMTNLLGLLLGRGDTPMVIEIEDATIREKEPNGQTRVRRVMPQNKVMLSNSQDDGDRRVMDLANGVIGEPIVAALTQSGPEELQRLGAAPYGPTGYYLPNPTFDPPHVTAYAVQRCFPRRHVREMTATLTVG